MYYILYIIDYLTVIPYEEIKIYKSFFSTVPESTLA